MTLLKLPGAGRKEKGGTRGKEMDRGRRSSTLEACVPPWWLDVFQCWKLLTLPFLFKLAHFVGFLFVSTEVFFPSCLSVHFPPFNTLMSGSTFLIMMSKCPIVRAFRRQDKTKQKQQPTGYKEAGKAAGTAPGRKDKCELHSVKPGELHQLFQFLSSLHISQGPRCP